MFVIVPEPCVSIFYLGGPPLAGSKARRDYREILAGDPCCYCGVQFQEIEHITPRSRKGVDEWDNLTSSCVACNRAKRALSLLEFLTIPRPGHGRPIVGSTPVLTVVEPAPALVSAVPVGVDVPAELVDALIPLAVEYGRDIGYASRTDRRERGPARSAATRNDDSRFTQGQGERQADHERKEGQAMTDARGYLVGAAGMIAAMALTAAMGVSLWWAIPLFVLLLAAKMVGHAEAIRAAGQPPKAAK